LIPEYFYKKYFKSFKNDKNPVIGWLYVFGAKKLISTGSAKQPSTNS
jgi:hypothetical protein